MQKLAFLTLCLASSIFVQAQSWYNVDLKLYVEDSAGRIDSISFGIHENATVGIDTAFAETNIYGTTWDSLDMRVIQRDSNQASCLASPYNGWITDTPYYALNLDSKVNFRPFGASMNSKNNSFEIHIRAVDYPVVISGNFDGIAGSILEGWSSISLLTDSCSLYQGGFRGISSYASYNDSIYVLPDTTFHTLLVKLEHEVSVKQLQAVQPQWQLRPNPAHHQLTISSEGPLGGTIDVFSVYGQRIRSIHGNARKSVTFPIAELPAGIYLLRYVDKEQRTVSTRKWVKQ